MKTIKILASTLATLVLAFNISTASAASCTVSDVSTNLTGGGSASVDACMNHSGNDAQSNYQDDINGDFGLSLNWIRADTNNAIGNLKISSGTWDFSNFNISNPFVIVLKAGNNFAAYLFNQDSNGTGDWITTGLPTNGNNLIEISHISLYTSVGQVPIPAAIWLFASALMGLVGIRKRYIA